MNDHTITWIEDVRLRIQATRYQFRETGSHRNSATTSTTRHRSSAHPTIAWIGEVPFRIQATRYPFREIRYTIIPCDTTSTSITVNPPPREGDTDS